MVELIIKENEAGQRLDKFLHKYMKEAGNGFLYKMLRKKNITLNGKKAEGSEKLCMGDAVKLFLSQDTIVKFGGRLPGQEALHEPGEGYEAKMGSQGRKDSANGGKGQRKPQPEPYKLAYRELEGVDVVFENHHILILNKPTGILTQKSAPEDLSLNEWLLGYLLVRGERKEEELHTFRPSVCNRLDRNTSGLVICGKTLSGSQKISELLRERSLRKFYRLYVKGRVTEASFAEGYLRKDGGTNRVTLVKEAEGASYIRTNYKPLTYSKDMTLLEAELITGKTHQIRLHLSGLGHPVLGDYKYGDKSFNDRYRKKYGVESQLLHACRLEFPKMDGEFESLSGKVYTAPEPELFVRVGKGESLL